MVALKKIWEELLGSVLQSRDSRERIVRTLGASAKGVRASVMPDGQVLELLIEVSPEWKETEPVLPEWRGMGFEIVSLHLSPRPENDQLVLSLREDEQKAVFFAYCGDLVSNLEGVTSPDERASKIKDSIARWGRFFEKCGADGLDIQKQAGLFGELVWLEKMIDNGIDLERVVKSWKGCERNFHDFDVEGKVVEVKTSMMKEPQQITINNERQLDERGLLSLHLFFVSFRKTDGGGLTLDAKVQQIREKITHSQDVLLYFNDSLINSGYLDEHSPKYTSHFIVKEEMLFSVKDDFPRIIEPPNGVGRLKYGVLISSCRSFDADISEFLDSIGGE